MRNQVPVPATIPGGGTVAQESWWPRLPRGSENTRAGARGSEPGVRLRAFPLMWPQQASPRSAHVSTRPQVGFPPLLDERLVRKQVQGWTWLLAAVLVALTWGLSSTGQTGAKESPPLESFYARINGGEEKAEPDVRPRVGGTKVQD